MNHMLRGPFKARAKVIGDAPIETVEARLDMGDWVEMKPVPDDSALWQAAFNEQGDTLTVRARDALGRAGEEKIELTGSAWTPPPRVADGSDRDRVGAWPEKGIFDTELGPNRNGRKW